MLSATHTFALRGVVLNLLAAALACQGETTVLLRVEGSAPGASALKLHLVDETGALPGEYNFPEGGGPLQLPGTILVKTGSDKNALGVFLWAQTSAGVAVAQVRSFACYKIVAGTQNNFTLELQAAPPAFSPNIVQDCRCQGERDMCGAPSNNTGGGGQGGSGGFAGAAGNGSDAGTSGVAGMGGIAADAGLPNSDAASMGGNMMTDAASVPDGRPIVVNGLFSFDVAGDWTSQELTVALDSETKTQGMASLSFTATETVAFIRGRDFATNEIAGLTTKLALDVHVPAGLGSSHNAQLWFSCPAASVYNAYVQYRSLANLPAGWNHLTFTLPAAVTGALMGQHQGCRFWIHHEAPGRFRYDNLRFVQP